jgi:hypothetical protein
MSLFTGGNETPPFLVWCLLALVGGITAIVWLTSRVPAVQPGMTAFDGEVNGDI